MQAQKIKAGRSDTAHALGPCRGELNTEIIAVVPDEGTALAVDVVLGQAGDASLLVPMLDWTLDQVEVHEIDGDQLWYDSPSWEVNPNIPLRANRHPDLWTFDPVSYRE